MREVPEESRSEFTLFTLYKLNFASASERMRMTHQVSTSIVVGVAAVAIVASKELEP